MKSVIQFHNLIPFELPNPLFLLLLLVALTLTGCGNQNETSTDSSPQVGNVLFQIPDSIASRLPASGTLMAVLTVNGGDQPPRTITGDTATFTLSGTAGETLNISITFTFVLDPFGPLVVAASTTKSLVVSAGASVIFVAGDYDSASFNQDGDSFSNLDELSIGSDPTDASDTPVANRVVFRGDLVTDNTELFSADLTGGVRIKLSTALQTNGDVGSFVLSPDGHYVAFTADATDDGINDVYVAPVDGSTAAFKISSVGFVIVPGKTFVSASSLQWAPDSSRIAWRGDFRADDVTELFTATPAGSQQTVNGPIVDMNGDVSFRYSWSPDSTRLAYIADQDTDTVSELYTAFPDGTGRLKVSGPMVAGGNVRAFKWAPDSSRLAYTSDEDLDEEFELFTADPAVANSAIRVSLNPIPSNPNADVVFNFLWAPDSSRIAYTHDLTADFVDDLYTTVPDSAAQVFKVNNTSLKATQFQSINFAWSPDSTLLAYRGDVVTDNVQELFIDTPDSQRASPKVSGTLVGMGGVSQFEWSPDGSILVFIADANIDNISEVFSVPADGSGRTQLSEKNHKGTFAFANLLSPRTFSPDGSQVVYTADHNSDEIEDLYVATPGVEKAAFNLSNFPPVVLPVGGFADSSLCSLNISPGGKNIAFVSDLFIDTESAFSETVNVHVAPLDGSTPLMDVTSNGPNEAFPSQAGWDPGGGRIVYTMDDDPTDTVFDRVFSNITDGSDQIDASGTISDNGGVFSQQIAGFLPEIEDNDGTAQSQELPFPLPVAGTVSPTDDDFFNFTPPVSGNYEFQLSTTATVNIEILDTEGLTVLPGGSGAKLLRPMLIAGSTYFVKLSGNGDYRFTFGQQGVNNNNNGCGGDES